MIERLLDQMVEVWIFAAPDLETFYERNEPAQRAEYKKQLKEQSWSTEHYPNSAAFFYG
ncbi:MAG TPA: hypothetical protein VGK59_15055 [Ohtaekwangia sp.]